MCTMPKIKSKQVLPNLRNKNNSLLSSKRAIGEVILCLELYSRQDTNRIETEIQTSSKHLLWNLLVKKKYIYRLKIFYYYYLYDVYALPSNILLIGGKFFFIIKRTHRICFHSKHINSFFFESAKTFRILCSIFLKFLQQETEIIRPNIKICIFINPTKRKEKASKKAHY